MNKGLISVSFLPFLLLACTAPKGAGTSLSSSESCVSSSSMAGFSAQSFEKVQIDPAYLQLTSPLSLFSMQTHSVYVPQNTHLVVMVDHECQATKASSDSISKNFDAPEGLELSDYGAKQWAHSLVLAENTELAELKTIFDDECIKTVSVDIPMKTEVVPTDTQFANQFYLTAITSTTAWDVFWDVGTGITQDVTIAIIDDGIQLTHGDLSANLWVNTGETAGNATDDDSNGYVDDRDGYNFNDGLASPAHVGGKDHGSHVSGLAAARWNNAAGISGVMGQNVKIMPLNVFGGSATASTTNIVNAINYAVAKGANVINMSLGGIGTSSAIATAMQNAVAAGTVITTSAGNDFTEITAGVFYIPAGYTKDISGALSVASFDAVGNTLSSFSNYSTTYVEIAAPGSDTTHGGLLSTIPNNTYGNKQGTSMASPIVAGAAALSIALSKSRGATPTAAQIETKLRNTSTQSSLLTNYVNCGRRLNLRNLATYSSSNP